MKNIYAILVVAMLLVTGCNQKQEPEKQHRPQSGKPAPPVIEQPPVVTVPAPTVFALEQGQSCCLCEVDQARKAMKVFPLERLGDAWVAKSPEWLSYNDETTIESVTVENIEAGETVVHEFTLLGYFRKEITSLSDLKGNRVTVEWTGDGNNRVLTKVNLDAITKGGTYSGVLTVGSDGSKGLGVTDDDSPWTTDCPCPEN